MREELDVVQGLGECTEGARPPWMCLRISLSLGGPP